MLFTLAISYLYLYYLYYLYFISYIIFIFIYVFFSFDWQVRICQLPSGRNCIPASGKYAASSFTITCLSLVTSLIDPPEPLKSRHEPIRKKNWLINWYRLRLADFDHLKVCPRAPARPHQFNRCSIEYIQLQSAKNQLVTESLRLDTATHTHTHTHTRVSVSVCKREQKSCWNVPAINGE